MEHSALGEIVRAKFEDTCNCGCDSRGMNSINFVFCCSKTAFMSGASLMGSKFMGRLV